MLLPPFSQTEARLREGNMLQVRRLIRGTAGAQTQVFVIHSVPTPSYPHEVSWKGFITGKLVDFMVPFKRSMHLSNQTPIEFMQSEWKVA